MQVRQDDANPDFNHYLNLFKDKPFYFLGISQAELRRVEAMIKQEYKETGEKIQAMQGRDEESSAEYELLGSLTDFEQHITARIIELNQNIPPKELPKAVEIDENIVAQFFNSKEIKGLFVDDTISCEKIIDSSITPQGTTYLKSDIAPCQNDPINRAELKANSLRTNTAFQAFKTHFEKDQDKDIKKCLEILTDPDTKKFYINPIVLEKDEKLPNNQLTVHCTREATAQEQKDNDKSYLNRWMQSVIQLVKPMVENKNSSMTPEKAGKALKQIVSERHIPLLKDLLQLCADAKIEDDSFSLTPNESAWIKEVMEAEGSEWINDKLKTLAQDKDEESHKKIISYLCVLINLGAPINTWDEKNRSLLFYAVTMKHRSISFVHYLVDRGILEYGNNVDRMTFYQYLNCQPQDEWITQVKNIISEKFNEKLKEFLESYQAVAYIASPYSDYYSRTWVIQQCILSGANPETTINGKTALFSAIQKQDVNFVTLLLSQGAFFSPSCYEASKESSLGVKIAIQHHFLTQLKSELAKREFASFEIITFCIQYSAQIDTNDWKNIVSFIDRSNLNKEKCFKTLTSLIPFSSVINLLEGMSFSDKDDFLEKMNMNGPEKFQEAIQDKNLKVVEFFLSRGINTHVKLPNGKAPYLFSKECALLIEDPIVQCLMNHETELLINELSFPHPNVPKLLNCVENGANFLKTNLLDVIKNKKNNTKDILSFFNVFEDIIQSNLHENIKYEMDIFFEIINQSEDLLNKLIANFKFDHIEKLFNYLFPSHQAFSEYICGYYGQRHQNSPVTTAAFLFYAVKNNLEGLLSALFIDKDEKCEVNFFKKEGMNLLTYANSMKPPNREIINILLEQKGLGSQAERKAIQDAFNDKIQKELKRDEITTSIKKGDFNAINNLMKNNIKTNNQGISLIYLIFKYMRKEDEENPLVLSMLASIAINPETDLTKLETNGLSPMHLLCNRKTNPAWFVLFSKPGISREINIAATEDKRKGYTPLYLAIRSKNYEVIKVLLTTRKDINPLIRTEKHDENAFDLLFFMKDQAMIDVVFNCIIQNNNAKQLMFFLYSADCAGYKLSPSMMERAVGEALSDPIFPTKAHEIINACIDAINDGVHKKEGLAILAHINNFEKTGEKHNKEMRTNLCELFRRKAKILDASLFTSLVEKVVTENGRETEGTACKIAAKEYLQYGYMGPTAICLRRRERKVDEQVAKKARSPK